MSELSSAHALAATQHGVLTREQALQCGLSEHRLGRLLRTGQWSRIRTGVYFVSPGCGEAPALATRVMAAQLAYGPRAVAVGPTAARLWRMQGLLPGPGHETVHLGLPGGTRARRQGLSLHGWSIDPGQVTLYNGIRLTTPARTLCDTVLLTDRHSAVSVIDSALQRGLVHHDDLEALSRANTGRACARRTQPWWGLTDGRSHSTFETRLRLLCYDAGIAPETLQHPVRDAAGTVIGHADLAWPSWGVVVEADGSGPHRLPDALFADRYRQNAMVTAPQPLVLLRFAWRDLHRPRDIVAMIHQARRSAATRAAADRPP
ncbi:type IV toxin-antitoxin system AbiEi family antitoxin domain-containing protein [Salinactinospora qingdaonensis]